MKRRAAVSILALFLAHPALAQPASPPTESVTVTGTKSRAVVQSFVRAFTTPTRVAGKIARWESGICPVTAGVQPAGNDFITARVKQIAAGAGAPVSGNPACKANIEIVFTRTPQALLDNVKRNQPDFLGYYDSDAQRDRLATVTRPIQAWYTTATQDRNGVIQVDYAKAAAHGRGVTMMLPCAMLGEPGPPERICTRDLPYATKANVTGSRLGDGLRSDLYNVIVVADINRLGQQELDTLGDYIALLALAQPAAMDACPPLPSILGLLADGCETRAARLTDADRGYLKALYAVTPGGNLNIQQDQIADRMLKDQ